MLSMDRELGWYDQSVFYRLRALFSIWLCFLLGIPALLLCLITYVSLFLCPLLLMTFSNPIANACICFCFSIILIYTVYWIHDSDTPYRGGRRSIWLRSLPLARWGSQYFPTRLVISDELREWSKENSQDITENGKSIRLPTSFNYLLGYHPHGAYCIGALTAFASESLNFSLIFPGITPYLASLNCFYNVPFYRDGALALGVVSASRESLVYILDKDITGTSGKLVAVVVGGAREVLESHPGRYVLMLSRRRGFFRMALQTGSHLVPSIGFGETNTYDRIASPDGSRLRKLEDWIVDKYRIPLLPFHSISVIPYRRPITVVVGRPIVCERIRNPTDEEVDELREEYKQQLVHMFNKYRPLYDPTAEDIRFI